MIASHNTSRRTGSFGFLLAAAFVLCSAGCKWVATPQDDATLTAAVQSKLSADTSLSAEPIHTSVQHAIVTLDGSVSSDAARALAANDAALVPGVRTVVNNLTVQPVTSAAAHRAASLSRPRTGTPNKPSSGVPVGNQTAPPVPAGETAQSAPIERSVAPTAGLTTPPTFPHDTFRAITLPTDTMLPIRINTALDSATTQPGDTFTGSIASDVIEDGLVVLAQGTPVKGRVDTVHEAGHFKGNSLLTITLTSIDRKGGELTLTTDEFSKAGNGRGKNTAEKVGGGAAIGAILGGILGGGKGAAIGAGVGGGTGAGVQAATKGQQVQLPAETLVRFHLTNPLVVRVSTADRSNREDGGLQNHDQ